MALLFDLIFPRSTEARFLDSLSARGIYERCRRVDEKLEKEKMRSKKCTARSTQHAANGRKMPIWSIFSYKDPLVKEMIWQIKFRGQRKYAEICGKFLYQKIIGVIGMTEKRYLLIPVPIHPKRRAERGFNQCEWLCEEIIKNDLTEFLIYQPNILVRQIYKVKQSWSNKKERAENMRGVFKISDVGAVAGQKIILIDDVITTGATLAEVKRILQIAGATEILSFTIAH